MFVQPRFNAFSIAVRQQIDGAMLLEVDEDRAVHMPFAKGNIIDPQNMWGGSRWEYRAMHDTQQCVRLVRRCNCIAVRAAGRPPRAKPSTCKACVKRCVRWARKGTRSGSRSAKVRRGRSGHHKRIAGRIIGVADAGQSRVDHVACEWSDYAPELKAGGNQDREQQAGSPSPQSKVSGQAAARDQSEIQARRRGAQEPLETTRYAMYAFIRRYRDL